ncbi:hypothetical protein [Calycomorphotria hydatis]|uniref:Uncharacterized protein n=1 Tax=Calycomorphotria hydatis TaxID=2528027 RepID=A0A517T6S6_9PLAN|nr:hypothetical protein [Calycomorphotria hydatis]QDT64073.1 hypothetical protein V22_13040 [Calycomorphotria hydatis]
MAQYLFVLLKVLGAVLVVLVLSTIPMIVGLGTPAPLAAIAILFVAIIQGAFTIPAFTPLRSDQFGGDKSSNKIGAISTIYWIVAHSVVYLASNENEDKGVNVLGGAIILFMGVHTLALLTFYARPFVAVTNWIRRRNTSSKLNKQGKLARQQQLDQQKRELAETERREKARFQCRLLYDRYASEIQESLSRKRFDDYLKTYLSDSHSADLVEQRAEELQKMILDFFEGSDEAQPQLSLEEIVLYYAAERERISLLDLDVDTKAAMLADLNAAEDKAIRNLRRP